jgi:SAM-dependent methyltransferase
MNHENGAPYYYLGLSVSPSSYLSRLTVARARRIVAERLEYCRYAVWVRWNGLDFSPVHDGASAGVFLADILRTLDIRGGSRIIDLGCGKGSAMCTMARFPFEEVAGVELSDALVRIAQVNAAKLRLRNLTFYVSDAADFTDYDRFSHFYMFNPFPAEVMEAVMNNLVISLARKPRRITVIYCFPACDDIVMQSGLFKNRTNVKSGFVHPCHVYVHTPLPSSGWV